MKKILLLFILALMLCVACGKTNNTDNGTSNGNVASNNNDSGNNSEQENNSNSGNSTSGNSTGGNSTGGSSGSWSEETATYPYVKFEVYYSAELVDYSDYIEGQYFKMQIISPVLKRVSAESNDCAGKHYEYISNIVKESSDDMRDFSYYAKYAKKQGYHYGLDEFSFAYRQWKTEEGCNSRGDKCNKIDERGNIIFIEYIPFDLANFKINDITVTVSCHTGNTYDFGRDYSDKVQYTNAAGLGRDDFPIKTKTDAEIMQGWAEFLQ